MTESEFWELTFAEFLALMDRRRKEFRLSHAPAALICSVMAEMKRDRDKRQEAFSPADFMPSDKAAKLPEPQSPEAMANQIRFLAATLGGVIE